MQTAIRRRDALQLEEERSGIDRDKKKRHHEEVYSIYNSHWHSVHLHEYIMVVPDKPVFPGQLFQ